MVEFGSSRDIPRMQCVLDGLITESTCTSPLRFTGLSPGRHQLQVKPQGCKNASKDSTLTISFEI